MKLIIQNNSIAGTATDAYDGPDAFITAPEDFDVSRLGEYVITDGVASIPPPGVPQSVTMRQARLALHGAGLLTSVDAAIASMTEPDKTIASITWEFAQTVDRGFGMVPALAASLGMSDTQIDDLFIAAAKL
jgi:hypothetical protein